MTVVVLAPHPDDEAIGCGGQLALEARSGVRTVVVFLTSGGAYADGVPSDASARREAEAGQAADVLGVAATHFLGYPDSALRSVTQSAARAVAALVADEQPTLLLIPNPEDNHGDHQAVHTIVSAAFPDGPPCDVAAYEVWTPLQHFTESIDISDVIEVKRSAIQAYRSQLAEFAYDRAADGLSQYRGALAGNCDYAEVVLHLSTPGAPMLHPRDWR